MIKMQRDTVLIQNILEGNLEAEEILYEKYKKIITDFLGKKYSLFNDVEDDVAEILIKVFMNISTYDVTKSKFKSWVFNIAKNHIIDKWRNNGTISLTGSNTTCTISTEDALLNSCITTSTAMIGTCGTFTTFNCCAGIEFENCSSINHISNQLSPQDFTLLDMKYVQGYNYTEIGSEFNVSSSTISNRVNYIKTKLKKNNSEIIYD